MNATDITNLISALRAETEKQSISPESVGYLLQTLLDLLTNIDNALQSSLSSLTQTHNSDKTALEVEIDNLKDKDVSLDEAITALGTSVADNIRGLSEDIAGLSISHNTDKAALEKEITLVKNTVSQHSIAISNLQTKENEQDEAIAALQESVTAMSEAYDELDTSINEHIAEVAIYAFNGDGPPSTSSSAYNGPAGIYYSSTEGLFYKTTSGSPSKSVPHNANGKARTDCLYRKGNVLYQYNGSTLSEYVSPSVAAELAELRSLIANLG